MGYGCCRRAYRICTGETPDKAATRFKLAGFAEGADTDNTRSAPLLCPTEAQLPLPKAT